MLIFPAESSLLWSTILLNGVSEIMEKEKKNVNFNVQSRLCVGKEKPFFCEIATMHVEGNYKCSTICMLLMILKFVFIFCSGDGRQWQLSGWQFLVN